MRPIVAAVLCLALASCSSPSKPEPTKNAPGVDSLCPLAAGSAALGGQVTIAAVEREPGVNGVRVVLRASAGAVDAFVHPRWFGEASLRREYRTEGDGWIAVHVQARGETRLWIPQPYPFATTLGLDVSAKRPAAPFAEGKALPGRLVVTPEQAAKLVLYRYSDLELSEYESLKFPSAPRLVVWRDRGGKVVAALEIHVRKTAKAAGEGLAFVHTNGKKTFGTSLAYANTKHGAPSDGWDFVIVRQGDGREVAVPWKPLVKNASFLGACFGGAEGLDASLVGDSARIGSIAEDGSEDLETVPLESPCWSQAEPTRGSLSSGAPVRCEYSGKRSQLWSVRTDDDMTFTPGAGGGGGSTCSGTLPSGSGTTELGTLHAARPGLHTFVYANEDLQEDPECADRLTTSDGPSCPGDSSAPTDILTDPSEACTSEVPGCTTRPVGPFVALTVPCSSAGGTMLIPIRQKDRDPGFVAVACDGDTVDRDLTFTATPTEIVTAPQNWIQIDNGPVVLQDNASSNADDPCVCVPCRLVVVIGNNTRRIGDTDWTAMRARLNHVADTVFGKLDHGYRNDRATVDRRTHLLGGDRPLYDRDGTGYLDLPIHAAQNYAREMARAGSDEHSHFVIAGTSNGLSGDCTLYPLQGTRRHEVTGKRFVNPDRGESLPRHFANCHKWDEILFIYHGSPTAFTTVVDTLIAMTDTPVKKIVFWSCWGAERIDKDGADFQRLVAHLVASKCNCFPRQPDPPPADPSRTSPAHDQPRCASCPLTPEEHCPYEGTVIYTAPMLHVSRAAEHADPVDISTPLSIDYSGGRWVLTSAEGTVRQINISREGNVTESVTQPPTVFGDTPLGVDSTLQRDSYERHLDQLEDGLNEAQRAAIKARLLPKQD